MGVSLYRFADKARLAGALAGEIAGRLAEGIAARGVASLVVPGGSTPAPLFDALASCDLPWGAVSITLTDERWVGPADPASNETLVRRRLLTGPAAAARFVGLKTAAPGARQAVAEVQARLATVPRPFDVTLLGMGEDGHTASLFPGSVALAASLAGAPDEVQAVEAPGAEAATERMTLALPTICDSRLVAAMITGAAKLAVLKRAAEPGDPLGLPICAVMARVSLQVFWAP